jgi:hypothetical protein
MDDTNKKPRTAILSIPFCSMYYFEHKISPQQELKLALANTNNAVTIEWRGIDFSPQARYRQLEKMEISGEKSDVLAFLASFFAITKSCPNLTWKDVPETRKVSGI